LYKAKCLDARFDQTIDSLVLYCYLENIGHRVVSFPRKDFRFKNTEDVPIYEMHKTADLFRGKVFNLVIDDISPE